MCLVPKRLEEGVVSPVTGVISGYVLLDVGVRG